HGGGDVRVADPSVGLAEALAGAGGLLLTGGEDVSPARYHESPHASVVDVNLARDEFEIRLIGEARRRDLPVFAICRGLQVLNVAYGGSLIQDIPTQVPGALEHKLAAPPHQPFELAHEIWIDKDTLLARLMSDQLKDADSCDVNSRHHQAVKDLA